MNRFRFQDPFASIFPKNTHAFGANPHPDNIPPNTDQVDFQIGISTNSALRAPAKRCQNL